MMLKLENGTELEAELKPLRVSQYPAAFAVQQQEDEAKLMGMILHPVDPNAPIAATIPHMLSAESYEAVVTAMPEVLRRFFAYCVRRTTNRALVDPELLRSAAAQRSAVLAGGNTSPSSPAQQA